MKKAIAILAFAAAGMSGCAVAPAAPAVYAPDASVVFFLSDENGRLEFLATPCLLPGRLQNIQEKYHRFFHRMRGVPLAPDAKGFESCWAMIPDGRVMVMTESGQALEPIDADVFQKGPATVKRLPPADGQEV